MNKGNEFSKLNSLFEREKHFNSSSGGGSGGGREAAGQANFNSVQFQDSQFQDFERSSSSSSSHQIFQDLNSSKISNFHLNSFAPSSHQTIDGRWKSEFHEFNQNGPQMNHNGPQLSMNHEFETIYTRGALSVRQQQWAHDFHLNNHQQASSSSSTNNMDSHQWQAEFEKYAAMQYQLDPKGKQVANEKEWIREFEEMKLHSSENGNQNWAQEFQSNAGGGGSGAELEEQEGEHDWQAQFEELWSRMKENPLNADTPGDWEREFRDLIPQDLGDMSTADPSRLDFNPDPVMSECAPYTFEPVNPYLEHENPFQAGLELLATNGSLSAACLAFEAAVQKDPHNDLAWQKLGMTQAENEKEVPAITALQRCVQENPKNVDALMGLAVSYTNEGHVEEAYASLDRWLSTRYPNVAIPPLEESQDAHTRLVDNFLMIIQNHHQPQQLDADIQIGLGLLFYNVQDYGKTIDCFRAAVSIRPDDYLLWNRLGATLSNSGDNEGAIDAYYKVLQLKPNFVRGRYNLGVSCMNIGCFKEAAQHFLAALSLHVIKKDELSSEEMMGASQLHVSRTLWDTLHRNFVMMERRDLADLASDTRDVDLFRKEFEF